jgi:hypothetical protein
MAGQRTKMEEVGMYTVQKGKIASRVEEDIGPQAGGTR